jgi:hypothetical protein
MTVKFPHTRADILNVSAHASGNLNPPEGVGVRLMALVRNFDRDANANRKFIRELAETDPEAFYNTAVGILKQQDDSRGAQHLVATLVTYDMLLRALCDPEFSREQSLELARTAARVDPMTDVTLAKRLADGTAAANQPISPSDAGRVMEILSEISNGTRILPSLMRLLRHSSPYVRSKAVKLVGRGSQSVKWVRARLVESDPRIRANAVEALWGVDTEDARELLQSAARDGNNRVAGNAMIALYRLGEAGVIPELLSMGEHVSALFRATAAWVMGESGDPRFTECLGKLLREPNATVRARALAALGRIKNSVAQARQSAEWRASALVLECDPQKTSRRVQVAVTGEEGDQPRLVPTQFILTEDGKLVLQYRITERPTVEAISAIFLFPRRALQESSVFTVGALNARAWKRSSDLWAVMSYGEDAGGGDEAPRYMPTVDAITAALTAPGKRPESSDLWTSIWRAVRAENAPARGKRHLIVMGDQDQHNAAGDGLISAVVAARASVQ